MTMRASWNGVVLAESDDTVIVEGNHYFPVKSLREEHFVPSDHRWMCPWKGEATYRSVWVDGTLNRNAAWEYRQPSTLAEAVRDRVAFWRDVEVVSVDATHQPAAG